VSMNDNDAHVDHELRSDLRLEASSSLRKTQMMLPHWCLPAIAAQMQTHEKHLIVGTFCTALGRVFSQKVGLADCSGERRESIATPRGVNTYLRRTSSFKKLAE
jgi:hypothetical protein